MGNQYNECKWARVYWKTRSGHVTSPHPHTTPILADSPAPTHHSHAAVSRLGHKQRHPHGTGRPTHRNTRTTAQEQDQRTQKCSPPLKIQHRIAQTRRFFSLTLSLSLSLFAHCHSGLLSPVCHRAWPLGRAMRLFASCPLPWGSIYSPEGEGARPR